MKVGGDLMSKDKKELFILQRNLGRGRQRETYFTI